MKKQLTIKIGQSSNAGRKEINQDFHGAYIPTDYLLDDKGIAIAIADGISSSSVSQLASKTAVTGFLADYYCTPDAWSVKHSVQKVLQATNSWLFSQTRNSPYRFNIDKGYVCTFSSLVIKSNTFHIFHSGDSRIYRLTNNNQNNHLEQLTEDHRRTVSEDTSYLTRALGISAQLELDYLSQPVEVNDIFILATDGIYEFASENEIIHSIMKHEQDLDQAAKEILNTALENGSQDNLTIQVVKIMELPDHQVNEVQQQVSSLPLPPLLEARKEFDGYRI